MEGEEDSFGQNDEKRMKLDLLHDRMINLVVHFVRQESQHDGSK